MRERLYSQGYKEDEILTLIKKRTIITNELMLAMYDYTQHHNNNTTLARKIDVVSLSRILFNVVNKLSDIDAKNYKDKTKDREERDRDLQMMLTSHETSVLNSLKSSKRHKCSLIDELTDTLNITFNDIKEVLESNKVVTLIHTLEKLKGIENE